MQAFSQIASGGSYKKEILSSGLEDYVNNQYSQALSNLGDLTIKNPAWSSSESSWFGLDHLKELLDSFPLLFYTWSAVYDPSRFSLAAMVRMQQTNRAVRGAIWSLMYELRGLSDLVNDINALYEVLSLSSGIEDGHLSYPDEAYAEQKGMAIEFKNVSFGYPSARNKVLKGLSFKIEPGQLCVIVGENGCGKSTTINLINRLYDCDSGEIHIDDRPIRDYKVSTIRAAINIMYQSYTYFPLAIKENLLMGCIDTAHPDMDVENAAKLGGAYDFIQELPNKFETNLQPMTRGWASFDCGEEDRKKFKCLKEHKRSDLSGGQWQRLAISRSFMKNSANTRLLCYDEPSASLDPKAEAAMFERLRKLRGEKTMIFVTQ
ncbi:hypothetical protein FRC11_001809 [Ceratobasidium sp. 423]|nr:hypothetical protein FRC11_001809 [Ceratobasidium sp. 423]